MGDAMNTCAIRKRVLFIVSAPSFANDLNYQAARMALSIVLDAVPHLLLERAALQLAFHTGRVQQPLPDFFEQERFLKEMNVPILVRGSELRRTGRETEKLRPGIKVLDNASEARLFAEMDHVLQF